jgi:ABC-type multidrug transport system ATPase subunit
MSDNILVVSGLCKTYGNFRAVDHLDVSVPEGQIFGFLGPNGAGKSTTIRMMLGLIHPDAGSIRYFGKDFFSHRRESLRKTGAIVERPDFYLNLSGERNLKILGEMQDADVSDAHISEVLRFTGLGERGKSAVKTYSQGMKQRLGIAQALLHDPTLIILDEPTNGLDPRGMREIRELVVKLNKERGMTVIFSSHLLHEVEMICHSVVLINKGKKVAEGKVEDILRKHNPLMRIEVEEPAAFLDKIKGSSYAEALASSDSYNLLIKLEKKELPAFHRWLCAEKIGLLSFSPAGTLEDFFIANT